MGIGTVYTTVCVQLIKRSPALRPHQSGEAKLVTPEWNNGQIQPIGSD